MPESIESLLTNSRSTPYERKFLLPKRRENVTIIQTSTKSPCFGTKLGIAQSGLCTQTRTVYMTRLVNLILFLGCAVAFGHYYGLASLVQLTAVVAATLGLMRVLSSNRIH
jgi:Flp pilus assembly protein TadB